MLSPSPLGSNSYVGELSLLIFFFSFIVYILIWFPPSLFFILNVCPFKYTLLDEPNNVFIKHLNKGWL